ncbi:MAG: phosphate ABC transporter substrate-binding protein PstS [Curvibacter sp.]
MPATFNVECRLSARNQTTAPETARLSLRRFCCFLILVVSNLTSICFAQTGVEVRGTGSSSPALVYNAWSFSHSKERSVNVQYSQTGSANGIKQIIERTVDFGATDSPVSAAVLKANELIQFPTMVGGVAIVVNLGGTSSASIRLTGPLLADLFSGDVKNWDDPRIAALNPGVPLPKLKVTRVVRGDGAGTTENLTTYLSTQTSTWRDTVGQGKLVNWKGEVVAMKDDDSISQQVKSVPGVIAYLSYDRVQRYGLTAVALRNSAGQFVLPSEEGFLAALRASDIRANATMISSLINLSGSATWPISNLSYILLDATPKSAVKAGTTARFFYWAFLKGDGLIRGTGFAPLPADIQALAVRKLSEIRPQDRQPFQLY